MPEELDFDQIMQPKKAGRPRKPKALKSPEPTSLLPAPSPHNKDIYINYPYMESNTKSDIQKDIKDLSTVDIKGKLTSSELAFLDNYLNTPYLKGKDHITIDKAMILAGYGQLSQASRYRIAKKICSKYERAARDNAEIFQALGYGKLQVARGIIHKAEAAQSEAVSLKALALAADCLQMREQADQGRQGINIIINTGPSPAAPGQQPPGPGPSVLFVGNGEQQQPEEQPKITKPLQISR